MEKLLLFFLLATAANRWNAGWSPDAGGRGCCFSRAGSDHSGGHQAEPFNQSFITDTCRAGTWRLHVQRSASIEREEEITVVKQVFLFWHNNYACLRIICESFNATVEQEDDVALPEVPTQPVPELPPEAAKAEPGTAAVLYDSFFY